MSIQSNIIRATSLAGILAHEKQRKIEADARQELSEKETFKRNEKPQTKSGKYTKIQQEKKKTAKDKLTAELNRLRFNPLTHEPLDVM